MADKGLAGGEWGSGEGGFLQVPHFYIYLCVYELFQLFSLLDLKYKELKDPSLSLSSFSLSLSLCLAWCFINHPRDPTKASWSSWSGVSRLATPWEGPRDSLRASRRKQALGPFSKLLPSNFCAQQWTTAGGTTESSPIKKEKKKKIILIHFNHIQIYFY